MCERNEAAGRIASDCNEGMKASLRHFWLEFWRRITWQQHTTDRSSWSSNNGSQYWRTKDDSRYIGKLKWLWHFRAKLSKCTFEVWLNFFEFLDCHICSLSCHILWSNRFNCMCRQRYNLVTHSVIDSEKCQFNGYSLSYCVHSRTELGPWFTTRIDPI